MFFQESTVKAYFAYFAIISIPKGTTLRLILKIYKNSFIKQYLFLFCFMVPIEKAKKCTLKMPQSLVRLISCEKFVFLDVLPSIVCACEFESLTDLTMLFMPQSHANCLDHHLAWCILSVICHCNLLWSLLKVQGVRNFSVLLNFKGC